MDAFSRNGKIALQSVQKNLYNVANSVGSVQEGLDGLVTTPFNELNKEFLKQQALIEEMTLKIMEAELELMDYIEQHGELADALEGVNELEYNDYYLQMSEDLANYKKSLDEAGEAQEKVVNTMIDQSAAKGYKELSNTVKTENKSMSSSFDTLLGVFEQSTQLVSGDSGLLKGMISAVKEMKSAFTDAGGGAASFFSSITSGAGLAKAGLTVLISLLKMAKQEEEARKKAAQESLDAYTNQSYDTSKMDYYIDVLKDETSSLEAVAEAREIVIGMFPDSVQGRLNEIESIKELVQYLELEKNYMDGYSRRLAQGVVDSTPDNREVWNEYFDIIEDGYGRIEHAQQAVFDAGYDWDTLIDEGAYAFITSISDVDVKKVEKDIGDAITNIYRETPKMIEATLAHIEARFGPGIAEMARLDVNELIYGLLDDLDKGNITPEQFNAALDNALDVPALVMQALNSQFDNIEDLDDGYIARIINYVLGKDNIESIDMQEVIGNYLYFDEQLLFDEEMSPRIQNLRQLYLEAFEEFGAEDGDIERANSIIDMLLNDEDLAEMEARLTELRQKIIDGTASPEEIRQHDQLAETISQKLNPAILEMADSYEHGSPAMQKAYGSLRQFQLEAGKTSDELYKDSQKARIAGKNYEDMGDMVGDAFSELGKARSSADDVGKLTTALGILKDYYAGVAVSAEDLAWAQGLIGDEYELTNEQIEGHMGYIDMDIAKKQEDAEATLRLGLANAQRALDDVEAWETSQGAATAGSTQIKAVLRELIEEYQKYLDLVASDPTNLFANFDTGKKPRGGGGGGGGGGGKKSGGGGGSKSSASTKNEALEREMKLLEKLKNLDRLTKQEELANLERILKQYAKTAEEKEELELKIYNLKKDLWADEVSYKMAMDQMTLQEEIRTKENRMRLYKAGTDARRELEKEVYQLKKDLARQEYDLDVYYGRLTLEQQRKRMQQMVNMYKAGTQQRIELEKELYDIQQQIRERDIERVNTLTDAIISALSNRYDELRKEEERYLKDSIAAWKEWGDEQVAQIQAQLDALDELQKEEDRAEEIRKREYKLASLQQSLEYEYDDYNRKKLEEEIAKAQQDLQDYLTKIEREDQKQALKDEMDAVKERVQEEEDRLNEQLDLNNEYYDELMKQQHLQAEAQKILMQSSQAEILNLLSGYASDYNLTGQTLGEQLVDGFLAKVGDIETWFGGLVDKFSDFQGMIADSANAAADAYYKSRDMDQVTTGSVNYEINMTFNNPVEDAIDVRRELERLLESMRQ